MVAQLRQRRSRLAGWSAGIAYLSVPVLVAAALLHRFDVIDTPVLLVVMAAGFGLALAGLVAAIAAMAAIWRDGRTGFGRALRGMIASLLILALPAIDAWFVVTLPRLADISTDLANPPRFSAVRISRPAAPGGDLEAEARAGGLQRHAYPDIVTHRFSGGTGAVFEAARVIVERRGWQVLDQRQPIEPGGPSRIEAIARTMLFAFRQGIVIRIESDGEGTRFDMRSASFVGAHDLGDNARRIRAFLADIDAAMMAAGG